MPSWKETPLIQAALQNTVLPDMIEQIDASIPTATGVPIITVDKKESSCLKLTRADQIHPINTALGAIYKEGLRLGAVDSTPIDKDVTAVTTSAFPISAHTPYFVGEKKSRDCWEATLADYDHYKREQTDALMVDDTGKDVEYIPAQLITWIMLRLKTGEGPDDYMMAPVDMYQLAQASQGEKITVSWGESSRMLQISPVVLRDIYASVERHLELHNKYLSQLYEQHIRPVMNQRMAQEGVDIVLGERNVRKIAHTMALGYSRDKKAELGVGGGSASNPDAHIHTTLRPDIDEIRRLILESVFSDQSKQQEFERRHNDFKQMSQSTHLNAKAIYRAALALRDRHDVTKEELMKLVEQSNDIAQLYHYLRSKHGWTGDTEIDMHAIQSAIVQKVEEVDGVLRKMDLVFAHGEPILGGFRFEDTDKVEPHMLFKQIDPYATMFHSTMDSWVQGELQNAFTTNGVPIGSISSFKWDKKEYRFDMRVTEGWEIRVQDSDFAGVQMHLNPFLAKMDNLWQDTYGAWEQWQMTRSDVQLLNLQGHYGLPNEAITAIKRIHPTDQQLRKWIEQPNTEMTTEHRARLESLFARRTNSNFRQLLARHITQGKDTVMRVTLAGFGQIFEGGEMVENDGKTGEYVFNKGLNIPGRPSFGVFYERINGGWIIRIHPLMGEKALAETEGTLFERTVTK